MGASRITSPNSESNDELEKPTEVKLVMQFARWFSDPDWRLLILIIFPLSLVVLLSVSSFTTTASNALNSISSFSPFKSFITNPTSDSSNISLLTPLVNQSEHERRTEDFKAQLNRSRIAVCLVGGARRFELTGPSIVDNILRVYPNSDLFLHSPLDRNAYKLSLFKSAPRIASVRIFEPKPVPETESQRRVLTAHNSPNGIQGLLQYFNLVEGCLTLIKAYQNKNNFTYDWVVRTRVDSYWSGPLGPEHFVRGSYVVPEGSSFSGLNDRLGVGQLNTSTVALSRLSLIPQLDYAGFRQLNSEKAFRAQLSSQNMPYATRRSPFCVVTDRKYEFPPSRFGVPVAALSSRGSLSGAKCRPCTPVCTGGCVGIVMKGLYKWWSWTEWTDGGLQLCDAHSNWEKGWERIFDRAAGKNRASARRKFQALKMEDCVRDFEEMRRLSAHWEAPPAADICRIGLSS